MPRFLSNILGRTFRKDTAPVYRYEGFQQNGAVVLRDRRGTIKAGFPDAETKAFGMGDDPLAIYKPTEAKQVDAAKAMGSFTGWTYAAVNAIASEVADIRLRLYQINGEVTRPIIVLSWVTVCYLAFVVGFLVWRPIGECRAVVTEGKPRN